MASSAEKKKKKGKDKESQNTQTVRGLTCLSLCSVDVKLLSVMPNAATKFAQIAVMFAKATSPDKPAIHKLQYKLEGAGPLQAPAPVASRGAQGSVSKRTTVTRAPTASGVPQACLKHIKRCNRS